MNTYRYQAIDAHGKTSRGTHQSISEEATRQYLSSQGKTAVDIQLKAPPFWKRWEHLLLWIPFRKVTVMYFMAELINLLKSGVSIGQALQIMSRSSSKYRIQLLTRTIFKRISTGESFWHVIADYQFVLRKMIPAHVTSSQDIGKIAVVLESIYKFNNKYRSFVRKIIMSQIIQIVSLFFSFSLIVFLIDDMVGELFYLDKKWGYWKRVYPAYIHVAYRISSFIVDYWLFLVLFLFTLYVLMTLLLKVYYFRAPVEFLTLLMYPISRLVMLNQRYMFFIYLDMYLKRGATFQYAFSQSVTAITNVVIRKRVGLLIPEIASGNSLSQVVDKSSFFSVEEKWMFRGGSKKTLMLSLEAYLLNMELSLDTMAAIIGQAMRVVLYILIIVLWFFLWVGAVNISSDFPL